MLTNHVVLTICIATWSERLEVQDLQNESMKQYNGITAYSKAGLYQHLARMHLAGAARMSMEQHQEHVHQPLQFWAVAPPSQYSLAALASMSKNTRQACCM